MFQAVLKYLDTLTREFGAGWNRFWFSPSSPRTLGMLRVLTGLVALYVVGTYSFDLVRLFAADGLIPVATSSEFVAPGQAQFWRFSYLSFIGDPNALRVAHLVGMAALVAFTIGLYTRITAIAALVVVLSYIQRAPVITTQVEPILTMVMVYLCLGPCGDYYSIDHKRKLRSAEKVPAYDRVKHLPGYPRTSATIAIRLIQVHLSAIYLMMALAKLSGQVWMSGEAIWWLAAMPESRAVDLTGWLVDHNFITESWSHAVILFELAFPVLIWVRLARPLMLTLSVIMWMSLGLVTGNFPFALMMLTANVAFISPEAMEAFSMQMGRLFKRNSSSGAEAVVGSPAR